MHRSLGGPPKLSSCWLPAGQVPAGGPQVPPQMMEQMHKHLSDPATANLITTFVQTMKPEDLAGILKQSGMDVSPEQVQFRPLHRVIPMQVVC